MLCAVLQTQPVSCATSNVVGTTSGARPIAAMCAPGKARGGMGRGRSAFAAALHLPRAKPIKRDRIGSYKTDPD
ncbi:hypothetical protein GCM10010344_48570 [Streptomyces bluensis]|nr:hypothetical protein GCM10010344_48570 [Streptomyces bluensis]